MTEERPQQKQPAPHWIAEDSINVIDGWCWGVNSYGKSICVGKEKDILEVIRGVHLKHIHIKLKKPLESIGLPTDFTYQAQKLLLEKRDEPEAVLNKAIRANRVARTNGLSNAETFFIRIVGHHS